MKRVSRQHEATYSEVKRLLIELPFYWLNSNLNKLVIYSNTVFLTAADGRIQLQTDYKPDKSYFLCCQFPNGFTGDIAQIDTNGLIVANYIYAPNATERFNGDLWVNLFGVFKIK